MGDALHRPDGEPEPRLHADAAARPRTARVRGVRVRIDRAVAATLSDAELQRRLVAGLPAELEPPLAEAASAELLRAVRRATRGPR